MSIAEADQVPDVSVVLCTYNGARFLSEQLDSLAAQATPIDRLVWRDDGSTDATVSIVRRWAAAHGVPLVQINDSAARLGPAQSFLTALAAGGPARVHLLADQDDVWLPTKVQRAVGALTIVAGEPCLYAARQHYVDHKLRALGMSPIPGSTAFSAAIYESQLPGCTMAMNEPLRNLLSQRLPEHALMHDWWIYILASAAGRIVFDESPSMLYRQHGNNLIGASKSGFAALGMRLHQAASGTGGQRSAQLREFGDTFSHILSTAQRSLIDELTAKDLNWWRQLRIAATVPVSRRGWVNRLGTRLSIARGRY